MASIVLGVAAGAIAKGAGYAAGGVAVAAATAVGTAVGAYIDQSYLYPALFGDEGSKESRYGSVTVSTADEGAPIYAAFGRRVRVPGLILFAADPREVQTSQRVGKRRSQAVSSWYTDMAIGFGKSYPANEGSLSSVVTVLADGAPVIDLRDDVRLTSFSGVRTVNGVRQAGWIANGHKYRSFWEYRDNPPVVSPVSIRTTPRLSDTVLTVVSARYVGSSQWGFPVDIEVTFDGPIGLQVGSGFVAFCSNPPATNPGEARTNPWVWMRADLTRPNVAILPRVPILVSGLRGWARVETNLAGLVFTVADPVPDGSVDYDMRELFAGGDVTVTREASRRVIMQRLPLFGGAYDFPAYLTGVRAFGGGIQEAIFFRQFDGEFPVSDNIQLDIEQERVDYNLNVLEGGEDDVEFLYADDGVNLQQPSARMIGWVAGNPLPAFRDMMTLTVSNWNLSSYGNRIPNIEGLVESSRTSLSNVLEDICKTHRLTADDLNLDDVPAVTVEGYRYSGIVEGAQALQPIMLVHDLVAQQAEDKLRIFPRASSDVIEIGEDEWLPGSDGRRLALERREQQRPIRSISVQFMDSSNDLEPGTVVEPGFDDYGEDRHVSTSMVMTEESAREIARRIMRDATRPTFLVRCSLPWTRHEILENDIIKTTVNGNSYRFRVSRVSIGQQFESRIEGITEPELPSGVTASATTTDPNQQTIPPIPVLRTEVWQGFDPSTGAYSDSHLMIATAASGTGVQWVGAAVFISSDAESTWRRAASISTQSTIGTAVYPQTTLGESSPGTWQPNARFVVDLQAGEVESVDAALAQAGGSNVCVVGTEVVSFASASALGEGEWLITGVLRGQSGSPAYSHQAYERFVAVGNGLTRVKLDASERGKRIAIKVVPIGATLDEVDPIYVGTADGPEPPIPTGTAPPLSARNVLGFTATDAGDGVLLSWLPTDGAELYEIRTGTAWLGARVIGRTSSSTYSWLAPRTGTINFQIRARFPGGLWSPSVATASITFAGADATAVDTETAPLPGTIGGSGVDATDSGGLVTIDSDAYEGTWTQSEINAGSVALRYWTIDWEGYATDSRTVDELPDIIPATYEGQKWTGEGRFGDEDAPGVGDWTTPADYPLAVENYPELRGYGMPGSPGDHTQVVIEARFDDTGAGSYTDWKPFEPQWRSSQKMQARMKLRRVGDHMQQTISRFRIQARS